MCIIHSMYLMKPLKTRLLLLFLLVIGTGCVSSISPFSHIAYEMAVDLKVDALDLMDMAELNHGDHTKQITQLKNRMRKAYEFANGRPKNELSSQQWDILISADHHLLGGFLDRWEKEGALGRGFIVESKALISDAFDSIISLESGKVGSTRTP